MLFYAALACLLSILFTIIVCSVASRLGIVDYPDDNRKLHKKAVPLLGGAAIFLSYWIVVGYLFLCTDLLARNFSARQLIFIFIGSSIVMMVGYFDDKYRLPAEWRLLLGAAAVLAVMFGGMNFDGVTNPFGGTIGLDYWKIRAGYLGTILIGADILIFLWLMGMMYTAKILDGLDGLSTGIAFIGSIMMAALASTAKFYQPDIRLMSLVFAGACLGFLLFNFYPAKIFLGEGGGMFIGLILGVLAVVAGGKIATALLVMAIPILDLARVSYIRLFRGQSLFKGDREHLHFRFLDAGLSQRQTVAIYYLVAFVFGITTLILHSWQKLIVLFILAASMLAVGVWLKKKEKSNYV